MALIEWKQISGDLRSSGNLTGSLYLSGSQTITGSLNLFGNQNIDGDVIVGGTITAQEFKTELISASILFESGSSLFGNSFDDTHIFTGSVGITGSLGLIGPLRLEGDQESTGSYKLELNGVDKYFSVNINGVPQVKINEEGVLQVVAKDTTPTAVTGGLFYSSSNEYYLGFNS